MARPREFNKDEVLDAAIGVFGEHGFAGTSTEMLTAAMKIGRQSLYATFNDKWQLYCSAVERYAGTETQAHVAALYSHARAIEGIQRMVERVVSHASEPCLGVSSISEFGTERADLTQIQRSAAEVLGKAFTARIKEAQIDGDIAADLDPQHVAGFLQGSFAAIRLAARTGAGEAELRAYGKLTLKALR